MVRLNAAAASLTSPVGVALMNAPTVRPGTTLPGVVLVVPVEPGERMPSRRSLMLRKTKVPVAFWTNRLNRSAWFASTPNFSW